MTPDGHLLLVRHAEPIDRDHCHGARSDPGLSALGHRQAANLALRLRLLASELGPVRRVLSSPAARAIATAVPLGRELGRAHAIDERWRERDFGTWEGRPWAELWPTVPEAVTSHAAEYLAWTPPEGETADEVAERLEPAVAEALASEGTTVVVTHAGPVRQALVTALDLPATAALRIEVAHGRVTAMARTEDAIALVRVGA